MDDFVEKEDGVKAPSSSKDAYLEPSGSKVDQTAHTESKTELTTLPRLSPIKTAFPTLFAHMKGETSMSAQAQNLG